MIMVEKSGLKVVRPEITDADDIKKLRRDPSLGDGITDVHYHDITLGKPRDFFRVNPDTNARGRYEIFASRPKDAMETEYYLLGPAMLGRMADARDYVVVMCIDRDGDPSLWPIGLARDGEKDFVAWTTARAAAKTAMDKWVKLVWAKKKYGTRDAKAGYAPPPDWSKVPALEELLRIAFGEHGIIKDENHPVFRDAEGEAPADQGDGDL
jgi:hypothetical protein